MKTCPVTWLSILLLLAPALGIASAQAEQQTLTLEAARVVAAAAAAEARRSHSGGAIAVVDDGGHLVCLERLDRTFPAAAAVAIEKARTAAIFRRPTRDFEEAITKGGRTSLVAVDVMTPLQGGVPILAGGEVIGAVGVSGAATAQQDEEIAVVAAAALKGDKAAESRTRAPGSVSYIESGKVSAAFNKGMPLLEFDDYKVHASHREAPGQAEVHTAETDIIYVLSGSATFVTGGTVVDGAMTGPGEVRGRAIQDGETRRLTKGDVIAVPRGTPHWFKEVNGPFDYYVVKVVDNGVAMR